MIQKGWITFKIAIQNKYTNLQQDYYHPRHPCHRVGDKWQEGEQRKRKISSPRPCQSFELLCPFVVSEREWGRGNTLTNYLDMTTYPPRGSQIRACTCTPFVPCRTRSQCSGCRSSSVCQRLKGKEKCWWNYSKNMKLSYKIKNQAIFDLKRILFIIS